MPGTMPAASVAATDSRASTAYSTRKVDGGIMTPSVPATATIPVAREAGYPADLIWPTASRDTVAAVPIDDPETAEKPAHAMTVATPSPPGALPTKWFATAKTFVAIFARTANIPMRMNIGMIVRVKLAVDVNGTEASVEVP